MNAEREEMLRLLREIYSRTPETAEWLDLNERIAAVLRANGGLAAYLELPPS